MHPSVQAKIRFKTYNTRRNLPPLIGRKRGEANFLGAFERVLLREQFNSGCGGRNFALANHGIADFIWYKTINSENSLRSGNSVPRGILYAFEAKLKNWKKAFQQAYKYSYFSDKAIVLLPSDCPRPAIENRDFFKKHNIGLWLFNREDQQITKILTPHKRTARNKKARNKVLNELLSNVQFA